MSIPVVFLFHSFTGPTVYWKVLIVEEKYYNIAVLKTIKNDIKWLENRGCKEKKKYLMDAL